MNYITAVFYTRLFTLFKILKKLFWIQTISVVLGFNLYANEADTIKKACVEGTANFCLWVGILHERGIGVDLNYSKARDFYEIACDKGEAWGCHNLAVAFDYGNGSLTENNLKAKDYYMEACAMGIAESCYNLGAMYYMNEIGYEDFQKTFKFYKKACKLGAERACHGLAKLYTLGKGTEQNYAKAKEYSKKACNKNYAKGCFTLGMLYYDGKGDNKDIVLARKFLLKACKLGDDRGCNKYEIVNNSTKGYR